MDFGSDWDVVVIGAGPGGGSAALHLARKGWRVLLMEKGPAPGTRKACGGGALADIKQVLSLPDAVCEKEVCRIVFSLQGKERLRVFKRPIYASFSRRHFDNFLSQKAVREGAAIASGLRVSSSRGGRIIAWDKKNDHAVSLNAKIVIYADGIPTLAWKDQRIGFSTRFPFHEALVYELASPNNSVEEFHFCLFPKQNPIGCFWIFPKRDLFNVGVARFHTGLGPSLKGLLDEFRNNHPLTAKKQVLSARAGLIPAKLASRLHGDGCLVVGDAAGFTDPVTGGGIQAAIRSGEVAALSAHAALVKGNYDARTLSLYPRSLKRTTDYLWIRWWGMVFRPIPFLTRTIDPGCYGRVLRLNFALSLWLYQRGKAH